MRTYWVQCEVFQIASVVEILGRKVSAGSWKMAYLGTSWGRVVSGCDGQSPPVLWQFGGVPFVLLWNSWKSFVFCFHEGLANPRFHCFMEIQRLKVLKPWRRFWHFSLHQIVPWWDRQAGILPCRTIEGCILEQWSFRFGHECQEMWGVSRQRCPPAVGVLIQQTWLGTKNSHC